MFIQIIPDGYFYAINENNSDNEFKSNVFQHIVSTKKKFNFGKVSELLEIINSVLYEPNREYKIEFDNEVFEFKTILVTDEL